MLLSGVYHCAVLYHGLLNNAVSSTDWVF